MTRKPPAEDVDDDDLEVGKPRTWAAGVPGVIHSMGPALAQMGIGRSLKTVTRTPGFRTDVERAR